MAEFITFPRDKPAEDISNSLEGLGFNIINVRQLTTNRRAPNGQTYLETVPLFLVTLMRNARSHEIFKLNTLNQNRYYEGRITQSSNWSYTMLKLPNHWPCLGQLQATPSMFVVWWWPPA
jgi:hypothetical protein